MATSLLVGLFSENRPSWKRPWGMVSPRGDSCVVSICMVGTGNEVAYEMWVKHIDITAGG